MVLASSCPSGRRRLVDSFKQPARVLGPGCPVESRWVRLTARPASPSKLTLNRWPGTEVVTATDGPPGVILAAVWDPCPLAGGRAGSGFPASDAVVAAGVAEAWATAEGCTVAGGREANSGSSAEFLLARRSPAPSAARRTCRGRDLSAGISSPNALSPPPTTAAMRQAIPAVASTLSIGSFRSTIPAPALRVRRRSGPAAHPTRPTTERNLLPTSRAAACWVSYRYFLASSG